VAASMGANPGVKTDETRRDGRPGSASTGARAREGFERLLARVALNEVGLVLSREVSRLLRTDKRTLTTPLDERYLPLLHDRCSEMHVVIRVIIVRTPLEESAFDLRRTQALVKAKARPVDVRCERRRI